MSDKKLGVAIHGAGSVARAHVASWKKNADAEIVSVSSRRTETAQALVDELPEVAAARCLLLSRIGAPVREPQEAAIALRLHEPTPPPDLEARVESVLRDHLARCDRLGDDLLEGKIALDRWPLDSPTRAGR